MKQALLFFSLLFILSCSSNVSRQDPEKIMLGNVTIGNGLTKEDISDTKADAALALAMRLTDKYGFVDKFTRDSLAVQQTKAQGEAKLLDVGRLSLADQIAFMRIDRFNSILRVELQLISVSDTSKRQNGRGYAFLNFRELADDKAVFDPTLLAAVQRAFAEAVGNKELFANLQGKLAVKPAPTLVVAGVVFEETEGFHSWKLVDKKTVSSYQAVEEIFDAAKNSPKFVTYDIETRDSIYKLFNLYLVENYSMPSFPELDALRKFDISYYIAGSYVQKQEQADLSLSLFKITPDNVIKLESVTDVLEKDDLGIFSELMRKMTKKLLEDFIP